VGKLVTNKSDANKLLKPTFRKGWELHAVQDEGNSAGHPGFGISGSSAGLRCAAATRSMPDRTGPTFGQRQGGDRLWKAQLGYRHLVALPCSPATTSILKLDAGRWPPGVADPLIG
jgi:hypothetical protein